MNRFMFPPALETFVELFNARRYWESHEVLERPWREGGSGFYKGLILYASAFVHLQNGNAHGVQAQLTKAARELGPYTPTYLGIDVAAVLAHASAARRVVEHEEAGWPERIDVPPLRLRRTRVRGTEAELRAG
ncbi:MAG: DUF309 domain-containing protein [Gemmatimonadota bacterium]